VAYPFFPDPAPLQASRSSSPEVSAIQLAEGTLHAGEDEQMFAIM